MNMNLDVEVSKNLTNKKKTGNLNENGVIRKEIRLNGDTNTENEKIDDTVIGIEVLKDVRENRKIDNSKERVATASEPNFARAIGVENAEFGDLADGFTIALNENGNVIKGVANATGGEEAFADGIRNIGQIELSNGRNLIKGTGTASTPENGSATIATGINNTSGGRIEGGDRKDILKGIAVANGQDNVNALGILTTDLDTGKGNDKLKGSATATGISTIEARGISNGFSDIDDDTVANFENVGEAPTASGNAEVGNLNTGKGNDILKGIADVTVAAEDGDEIFFAGANGIVNDGGTLNQLEELLGTIGKDLTNFDGEDVEQIIDRLDTSTLNTGKGDDRLIAEVTLNASQDGSGADEDLEVIGDGIENAGDVFLGSGNDAINSTVSVTTTIPGAKGLADALDNSSVGIITGLDLEVNNETLFDLGSGDDTFTSNIFATAIDDLAAADGLGNRGVFVAGAGDDTFNLNARAEFVLKNENDNEQQEGIADGWENRSQVFLDNPKGGGGDDSVTASATALGEGVLTIAEGIESRELFDTGDGDDTLNLTAVATTQSGALSDNLTQAAGMQTEQIDEGELFLGTGNNSIVGNATATSEAVGDSHFTPTTFAFGITQMTADANNTEPDSLGAIEAGNGEDLLQGTATATGKTDVAAFGLLLENTAVNGGKDTLIGNATAESEDVAIASGIAVGLAEDVFAKPNSVDSRDNGGDADYGLGSEAGILDTGNGNDTLKAKANAVADNMAIAKGIDGANGDIDLGSGSDTIAAEAIAISENGDREAIGIFGGKIDAGNGADHIKARSNQNLHGAFGTSLVGGRGFGGDVAIDLGRGNDNLLGFGAAKVNGGAGIDTLQFEFSLVEFVIGGGSVEFSRDRRGRFSAYFTFADVTLKTKNFERVQFDVDFENASSRSAGMSYSFGNESLGSFADLTKLEDAISLIESIEPSD